jgi:hypothetical protein
LIFLKIFIEFIITRQAGRSHAEAIMAAARDGRP